MIWIQNVKLIYTQGITYIYVGRPVKTWEEEVKNTIEEWGLKKETAKDRALWKHGTCGKPSNPRKRGKLT